MKDMEDDLGTQMGVYNNRENESYGRWFGNIDGSSYYKTEWKIWIMTWEHKYE